MSAPEHSTFWLLYGQYGATMTFETFCREFFPQIKEEAIRGRMRGLQPVIGRLYDVRDVADWWDSKASAPPEPRPAVKSAIEYADEWLDRAKMERMRLDQTCIYFLFDGANLVYVGKSRSVIGRLNTHISRTDKVFDSIAVIPCPAIELDETEERIIAALRPRYNKQYADRFIQ